MNPRAAMIVGHGINCDRELEEAFRRAGADAERVHLNDLLDGTRVRRYHILALPGGFSFGDDTFAGNIFAKKIIFNPLKEAFRRHLDDGRLVFGVCNGNQIGTVMNLIPAFGAVLDAPELAYTYNSSARYEDRGNIHLKVASQSSRWLKGLKILRNIPVGHGEGRFFAPPRVVRRLYEADLVALKYVREDGKPARGRYPANPNNSIDDIAGLASEQVLLLMPHPERAIEPWNQDGWTRRRSLLRRQGKDLPPEGEGMAIFKNGVEYIRDAIL
jgi:phosphoribosylformylglycinamidine (FGAM) synthase-like amidotransferase family enzyme